MTGIAVGGIGSGLDINSLVTQLVAAEGQPAQARLNRREVSFQTELSALGTLKGALAELQSAVKGLVNADTLGGFKASLSSSEFFTASAADDAAPGSYQIEVKRLAQAQKLVTRAGRALASPDDVLGGGTLNIRFGAYAGGSFTANPDADPQTLTIDPGSTLNEVRDAINAADVGVTANVINDGNGYRLALSAVATGKQNALEITVDDADGNDNNRAGLSLLAYSETNNNMLQTVAPKDARVIIDGVTVNSQSNTLDDALQGVNIELTAAQTDDADGPVTLTVGRDTAAASGLMEKFVKAYNNFVNVSGSLSEYNPDGGPSGTLIGDAGLRAISGQLRRLLSDPQDNPDSKLSTFADLGVGTERDGTLRFDSQSLTAALEADPQGLTRLLTGDDGESGLIGRFDRFLDQVLGSGGPLSQRTESLNNRIDKIGDQREALARRLDGLETRYRAQFTALDQMLSQLTATGDFLSQQLGNLPLNNKS